MIQSYRDLEVWKEAISLAVQIYSLTSQFPKEEMFGISNQLRRASVSVSSNIAEGCGRQYKKETIQFLYTSVGSLNEIESQLEISKQLEYLTQELYDSIKNKIVQNRKLVFGFIKYLKAQENLK